MLGPAMSLKGNRDPITRMWIVNIENTPNQTEARVQSTRLMANNVYKYKKKNIVTYLHKAAFSPVKSTWMQAIQAGFVTTCTGLTAELADKHLDKSAATVKGHLRKIRKNIRSTKIKRKSSTTINTSNDDSLSRASPSKYGDDENSRNRRKGFLGPNRTVSNRI